MVGFRYAILIVWWASPPDSPCPTPYSWLVAGPENGRFYDSELLSRMSGLKAHCRRSAKLNRTLSRPRIPAISQTPLSVGLAQHGQWRRFILPTKSATEMREIIKSASHRGLTDGLNLAGGKQIMCHLQPLLPKPSHWRRLFGRE